LHSASRRWTPALLVPCLLVALALPAQGFVVPAEGQCPPYPVRPGGGDPPPEEDVVPPLLPPGTVLDLKGARRLEGFLPREVWERRDLFFYEGMQLEVGPCHRRYPAPPFFNEATERNAATTRVDEEGNLLGYGGQGLPFAREAILDDDPAAGQKWAWNVRYRYLGAGFRGPFRILHLRKRGRKVTRFEGTMTFLPLHGVPGVVDEKTRFAWAGKFRSPEEARGVAWRQYRPAQADADWQYPDETFVYVPEERRVRRAPPGDVDGLFVPSYMRGAITGGGKLVLPEGMISTPDPSIAVGENWRRGFVGLLIRPNAYQFKVREVRDVIAPINARSAGYPQTKDRSYGSSGLSLATDRWEIRRAVVIDGVRRSVLGKLNRLTLWVDALTAQPLYMVTQRPNGLVYEVGIFMGSYSGDDLGRPMWDGNGESFGAILPVAESVWVIADQSWLRESFDLRMNPLTENERRDVIDTFTLQKEGH
jgi:hypothetical protein